MSKVSITKRVLFVCDHNTAVGVMVGLTLRYFPPINAHRRLSQFSTIWAPTWPEGGWQTLLELKLGLKGLLLITELLRL